MADELRELLYRCIKELDYVQSVENCSSGLCASRSGAALVDEGMKLLGVADLSTNALPTDGEDFGDVSEDQK